MGQPNVFQICTLNETIYQEKTRNWRGLRLSVKQDGTRTQGLI